MIKVEYELVKTIKTEKRITKVECSNCTIELEPVLDSDQLSITHRKEALEIHLYGGYGMYFDGNDFRCLLCKNCADKLIVAFPCFTIPTTD